MQGPKYYPDEYLSDQDERFFVTEFVREAIFELFNVINNYKHYYIDIICLIICSIGHLYL